MLFGLGTLSMPFSNLHVIVHQCGHFDSGLNIVISFNMVFLSGQVKRLKWLIISAEYTLISYFT